jgi:transcription-repair coupling factor (superfamily II helicase)
VLSCPGIGLAAQPFFAAMLRRFFPGRPVLVVAEGLKSQESVHQDIATWVLVLADGRVLADGHQILAGPGRMQNEAAAVGNPPPHEPAPHPAWAPLFYPSWETLPHEAKLPHVDVISERLETLVALANYQSSTAGSPSPVVAPDPPIIVTSVVALLQRTFPCRELQEHTRSFKRGDRIDPLDLVEWLEAQGYEPEAQVTQKGEIALRGGILDVYPLTSPWPVRLEFFGDELESLREFDPLTQISREAIQTIALPPAGELGRLKQRQNAEGEAKNDGAGAAATGANQPGGLAEGSRGSPRPAAPKRSEGGGGSEDPRVADFRSDCIPEGCQNSATPPGSTDVLGRQSLGSLIDYLPPGSLFLICEPELVAERAEEYEQQVPDNDPFFIAWEELQRQAVEKGITVLGLGGEDDLGVRPSPGAAGAKDRLTPDDSPAPAPSNSAASGPEPSQGQLTAVSDEPAVSRCSEPAMPFGVRPSPGAAGAEDRLAPDNSPAPALSNSAASGPEPSQIQPIDVSDEPAVSRCSEPAAPEDGRTPQFVGLEAYRPLLERAPEAQVAEVQRREFFDQLHRWLRQGYAVHVFCNNDGERQRFGEIWEEYGLAEQRQNQSLEPAETGLRVHLGTLARGFLCEEARVVVVTDAEIFGRYKVQRPRRLKSPHAQATRSALDIDFTDLEDGDYVVHLQHGIGRYAGLQVLPIGAGTKPTAGVAAGANAGQECLVIEYAPNDPAQPPPRLYVPVTEAHLVSKYVGTGKARPPLNTLGGTRWAKAKAQAERAVRDLAGDLLSIQAARESQAGHPFGTDTTWQREFEGSFLFEETPDQMRAIVQTKADMERPKPMDRLICGDVGFGKTEVGIRAAFKAVMGGKQVAVLVPTTVLAQQHFNTFRERMADYPVRIELLSRFRTRRAQQQVVKDLAAGSVDVVIGTHRLLQGDIGFKDLGLVVIDEEQRFGVMHKEKFKTLRKLVDVLTLSATPIPRTLYLALTGARDMSTIQTPPHDRLPVETVVTQYDERVIRDAIQRELNRGGQVFFLHNRVMTIQTMAQKLATLVPRARLLVGHGQMNSDELEEVMTRFINGEADVLLSTTIIESGLDIPNANTIIIDRADRFGLSDLYQLRGRVGRYKHQAYAYLLLPRHGSLLTDVRKRMSAIKQYSTLGSGFKIAMRDLEIRGAGNLLGSQQSGHITAVGFELYCQLLKQSVASLKGEKVKPRVQVQVRLDFLALNPAEESRQDGRIPTRRDSSARSVAPETPERVPPRRAPIQPPESLQNTTLAAYIPFSYASESRQRIEIYRKLAQATEKSALEDLQKELRDRFGPLPPALELLLQVAELKILAAERGVSAIEVKEDKLMLTRNGDYIMVGSKFPRLMRKAAPARLKEIKKLLLAI